MIRLASQCMLGGAAIARTVRLIMAQHDIAISVAISVAECSILHVHSLGDVQGSRNTRLQIEKEI
jgi:hypothetical protein